MRFLRPYTTRFFNPLSRRVAGRLPGFGILTYPGRKSGRVYRTPINVFRRGEHYLFALTYGSDVNWVKNVLAAGDCDLRTVGRDVHLVEPEVFIDARASVMPIPVRWFLRFLRTTEFLRMRRARPTA
jgi:deazaflavin-dependent oxidoreductase (nitroreductase family)